VPRALSRRAAGALLGLILAAPAGAAPRDAVRRAGGTEAITVRPMDRYRFYRTSDK